MADRKPVLICSPYAGDRERNDAYLKAAIADSLARNEAPWASHGFYPLFLNDADCDQRALGLECEHVWLNLLFNDYGYRTDHHFGIVAVYEDLGISSGMALAIHAAEKFNPPLKVERRSLPGWAKD